MDLASPMDMYSDLQARLSTIKAAGITNTTAAAGRAPVVGAHRSSAPATPLSVEGISNYEASEDPDVPAIQQQQQLLLPWVQKYQPTKAADVCGNGDAVGKLKEWLSSWQDRADGGGECCGCSIQALF